MSDQPLRFLHASDFQLDTPLSSPETLPDHLRSELIDAPFHAARRVIDTALAEQIDFLVLCGNLVDPSAPSARALAFVQEQFMRLHEGGVVVYWASGMSHEAFSWPEAMTLPQNIHGFASDGVAMQTVTRDGAIIATISGRSGGQGQTTSARDFQVSVASPFKIGVTAGTIDPDTLALGPIDYWALAGAGNCTTASAEDPVIHDPGTPQGRSSGHVGPHGCTLVEVDALRDVRLRFIPCDFVRWHDERTALAADQPWDSWQATFKERLQNLRALAPEEPILVRWTLDILGFRNDHQRLREMVQRLASWLRDEFGHRAEPIWTLSVELANRAHDPSEWIHEDTLLGDYLRAIDSWRESGTLPLDDFLVSGRLASEAVRNSVDLSDAKRRGHVLERAGQLGMALLRGEEIIESPTSGK